jgi:hypothetical protein
MANPFRDPSLLVRTLAFSAAIFGVSLGLCGLNASASSMMHTQSWASPLLATTAIIEACGMVIGAFGMALSAVAILLKLLWRLVAGKG